MWQSILKYIGIELVKSITLAIKDWLLTVKAERAQKKLDGVARSKAEMLLAIEVARVNNDIQEIKRIVIAYNKLPKL